MKAAAKQFVLDASVTVAWCFEDASTAFTEGILDLLAAGAEGVAPGIWPLEIANALLVAERRKRHNRTHLPSYCSMYPPTAALSVSINRISLPAAAATKAKFNVLSPVGVICKVPVQSASSV